jgi:hypothetical protein
MSVVWKLTPLSTVIIWKPTPWLCGLRGLLLENGALEAFLRIAPIGALGDSAAIVALRA